MELGKPSSRYVISAKNNLIVFCNLKVRGLAKERNKEDKKKLPAILQAEVEFAMEFRLPEGDIPGEIRDKGLPAFSRLNGPYICWPYFRQFIYSICSQANITNVTLPILTVGVKQKKSPKTNSAEIGLKVEEKVSLKT
jgi:preprotein translocase subunit SecB